MKQASILKSWKRVKYKVKKHHFTASSGTLDRKISDVVRGVADEAGLRLLSSEEK